KQRPTIKIAGTVEDQSSQRVKSIATVEAVKLLELPFGGHQFVNKSRVSVVRGAIDIAGLVKNHAGVGCAFILKGVEICLCPGAVGRRQLVSISSAAPALSCRTVEIAGRVKNNITIGNFAVRSSE